MYSAYERAVCTAEAQPGFLRENRYRRFSFPWVRNLAWSKLAEHPCQAWLWSSASYPESFPEMIDMKALCAVTRRVQHLDVRYEIYMMQMGRAVK